MELKAGQHGLPVADAAARVLGADGELAAERFHRHPRANRPFDGPAEDLDDRRADAHLGGQLVGETDGVGVEVHVPAVGLGVIQRTVPQDRGGQRLLLRRRVEELVGWGEDGARPGRVDPAVGAEAEAWGRVACAERPQPPPREAGGPGVDAMAGGVERGTEHPLEGVGGH